MVFLINCQTGAISEYRNYPFNSICRIKDRWFGASPTGIYVLSGETDNGTDIEAWVKTGDMDLKAPTKKRVTDVYVVVEMVGKGTLRVVCEEHPANVYDVLAPMGGAHNKRVVTARGISGQHWSFEFRNVAGAFFELYGMEILFDVLSRRV